MQEKLEKYEPENQMISTLKVRTIIEFQAKSFYRSRAVEQYTIDCEYF